MIDKASRLAFGLISNHPFIDGNKRISTHAMLVLLMLNGVELHYEDEDLVTIILRVASGKRMKGLCIDGSKRILHKILIKSFSEWTCSLIP